MKKLLLGLLLGLVLTLGVMNAYSQYRGGAVGLTINHLQYHTSRAFGIIRIDAEFAGRIDEITTLRQIKIDLISKYFDIGKGFYADVTLIGYHERNDHITINETFRLSQIKLINAQISKVQSLGQTTLVTLTAHVGLGSHSARLADQNMLMLSDEEFEQLKIDRACPNCDREGVRTAGSLPVTAGLNATINYKKSYFHMFGDFQRSGMYRRLLDEEGDQYNYGYRMVFNWERRNLTRLGVELGTDICLGTLKDSHVNLNPFIRSQINSFKSRVSIAEQGDADFYQSQSSITRDQLNLLLFEAGVRVNLRSTAK